MVARSEAGAKIPLPDVPQGYRAFLGKGRDNMDRNPDSVFEKGSNAIAFQFNNVPSGVRTNAEAGGSFTQVEVSRKSAMEERAAD